MFQINLHMRQDAYATPTTSAQNVVWIGDGSGSGSEVNLFLGTDDAIAITNAERIIEALQTVRTRALARMVAEQADPITAAKAEADR